jgi:hypothetical protein
MTSRAHDREEDLLLFLKPGAKSKRRPLLSSSSAELQHQRRARLGTSSSYGGTSPSSSVGSFITRLFFRGGLVHRLMLLALALWTVGVLAIILSGAGGPPDEINSSTSRTRGGRSSSSGGSGAGGGSKGTVVRGGAGGGGGGGGGGRVATPGCQSMVTWNILAIIKLVY